MASLNTVFKQVYGEALKPLGYVKLKGKYPYYVRLVGSEILHIITYIQRPDKHYEITGGVATVYRPCLTFDESPRNNGNWLLKNINEFYKNSSLFEALPRYSFNDLYRFYYGEDTAYNSRGEIIKHPNRYGTIVDVVEHSYKLTEEIMLPVLNKAIDIDSCIEFFHKFRLHIQLHKNFNNDSRHNEGILYAISNNCNFFIENNELASKTRLDKTTHSIESGKAIYDVAYIEHHKKECQKFIDEKDQRIVQYNENFNAVLGDSEIYAKALAELERRKVANTAILRGYGLDL